MIPSALVTDLYELTMLAGYDQAGVSGRATFELFVRTLPEDRGYLVSAGLEQALQYLETLRFTPEQIGYLRHLPNLRPVPPRFFDETLPAFRFTGDVWAMPEGTPVFGYEPLLRVTAPMLEAQVVETALLAIVNFQTLVASKAARVALAAGGRQVMEFGARRAHGPEASVLAARAAHIGGCHATSCVEAGFRYGIPLSGTMAHSWVTSFADELEAYRRYMDLFGPEATLLIDTYDTVEAARKIVAAGLRPAAVRLDSGDLLTLSLQVREVFDTGGLTDTRIVVSGDLDEWSVADLLGRGAPIDAFGVGTAIVTSIDAPALGGVYKLVEVERDGETVQVMKLSGGGKSSLPGRKQVWRTTREGAACGDVIGLDGEPPPAASRPLLECVMQRGFRTGAPEHVSVPRARCRALLEELPPGLRVLDAAESYPVSRSAALEALAERTAAALRN